MDKYFMWIHYERLHYHNKAKHNKTVCIFLGILHTAMQWQQKKHKSDFKLTMMTSSNGNIFRVTGHMCGKFTGPGEFPAQRPVTRSFDVSFDLHPHKRLSKQSWGWWFETLSRPLWRHRNAKDGPYLVLTGELLGACYEDFWVNSWRYNGTALYGEPIRGTSL